MLGKLFLALTAFILYIIWQLMPAICLVVLALLSGCNAIETTCHYDAWGDHYCTKTYYFESTPEPQKVIVVEEKAPEDTLIYIENIIDYDHGSSMSVYHWSYQCHDLAYITAPYQHDPWYCYHYGDHHVECDWYFGGGCYEVWAWDDWYCEWDYLYSYCE